MTNENYYTVRVIVYMARGIVYETNRDITPVRGIVYMTNGNDYASEELFTRPEELFQRYLLRNSFAVRKFLTVIEQ